MGRHRKPRHGLPPVVSGAGIGAVLIATVWLVQPADIPGDPTAQFTLPAPTPARVTTSPPTTTAAPPTTLTPTTTLMPPVVTVRVEPTAPAPTTTRAEPKPEPKPERPADVAPEPPAEVQSSPKCQGLDVLPQVVKACNDIVANVPGIKVIGGRAPRPDNPTSCHPLGLALDLMTYDDKTLGDRVAAYVRANKERLGLTTILWRVADHHDHVHLSVLPCVH